jgi:hypothetical protein
MKNEDVVDLYERVHIGAPVYVMSSVDVRAAEATPVSGARQSTNTRQSN